MRPVTKQRLNCSCAGGLAIPSGYGFLLFLLERVFHIFAYPGSEWFAMPLAWPAGLYYFLAPRPVTHSDLEMPDMSGLGTELLLVLVGNLVLYSLLTSLLILWRQ